MSGIFSDAACTLFDLQVNGFTGVDFQQPELLQHELRRAVEALHRHETHRVFLTLVTDEIDALCRKFARLEKFRRADPLLAETICGYHLEGPWLSPQPGFCGAHSGELQRAPTLADLRRLQEATGGHLRLITLAPEWPGSAEVIAAAVASGIVISLGHTDASEETIDEAIRAGATLCTHLGNGVPLTLPRHDNIVQRLLTRDELTACLIPDGAHLPPFVLKNFFRAKPPGKVVFTTDCMAAAAAPEGRYLLGAAEVESRGGVVRKPGEQLLAGSSLTPDRGVQNAARWLDLPLAEARAMFAERAADLFGIALPMLDGNERRTVNFAPSP